MDPKQQASQLDPKLKEAYERVMGTAVTPSAAAQPTAPSAKPVVPLTPNPTSMPSTPNLAANPVVNNSAQPAPHPMSPPATPMPNTAGLTNSSPITPNIPPVNHTSVPPTPNPVINHTAIPTPVSTTPSAPAPTLNHNGAPVAAPTTTPHTDTMAATVAVPATTAAHTEAGVHGFVAKKKSPVSAPILILGGIVFLVVYALFWLKLFNIPIPFLPQ